MVNYIQLNTSVVVVDNIEPENRLENVLVYSNTTYFNYCFPKNNNNLKEIFNTWDRFINNSINEGHSHFSITINITNMIFYGKYDEDEDKKKSYWKDYYKDILKMHPIEIPFYDVGQPEYYLTKYSKFRDLEAELFTYCRKDNLLEYVDIIMSYTNSTTWFFLVTEENKQGVMHLHGLFAVKNLMDYNKLIAINLLNELKRLYTNCDIVIKPLNSFKQVKGWVKYLHIGKTWIFKPYFFTADFRNNGRDEKISEYFLQPYVNNYRLHNTMIKDLYCVDHNWDALNYFTGWGSFNMSDFYEKRYLKLSGCILNKNKLTKRLILDMVSYYLTLNDLYVYKEHIYAKIENSIISYKAVGFIQEVLYDEFQNKVIAYFLKRYPCHFIGFDFWSLLLEFKQDSKKAVLDISSLITNRIQFDFTLMEFVDGIYDIKQHHFYPKDKLTSHNIFSGKHTIKHYDKYYSWVRKNSPKTWITLLAAAVQNDRYDFESICMFLAQLFQNDKDKENKKRYLYVFGESNTNKTSLLAKPLARYFGDNNVGSVIGGISQFKYQNIENKITVIMDEFRYHSNDSAELLKLLSGEPLLVNKKYAKEHITIANFMGLIISNLPLVDQNIDIQNALLNRMYTVQFKKNNYTNTKDDLNKLLAEEEAEIIVFCNKLYFHNMSKRKTIKKIPFVALTTQTNKTFSILKAVYVSTHKYDVLKFRSISWNIGQKFKHHNARFDITDSDTSLFLSFTTTPYESFGQFLWYMSSNTDQYLNYNNMCIIRSNLANSILRIKTDNENLADSLKLHNKLLNSGKLIEIELYLTSAYTQFERCIQLTQDVRKCNTMLIKYSNQAEIMLYFCQNIFIGL